MKRYIPLFSIFMFAAILVLYESMAPTKLSSANFGSDGGDYLAAVLTNGIPHPTGYPIYLIISAFFQKLFSENTVWKQAQLSILPGAIAASLLIYLIKIIRGADLKSEILYGGLIASFSLALAPLFWSQSVIIEVYALNAFFIVLAIIWIFLVIRYSKNQSNLKQIPIMILAWVCGLGLGNHTTYMFIYPLVVLVLWILFHTDMKRKLIILCAFGWLSGIFSYLILPIRAQYHPFVNWGDPVTWEGFYWLIKGGDYGRNVFGIQIQEYPTRIISWISLLFKQFGIFGMLAGFLGAIYLKVPRTIRWSTIYIFFVYSIFALSYKTNDSLVYLIPSLIIFALWIGWGIIYLWQKKWKTINLGLLLILLIFINTSILLPSRYQSISPTNGDLAHYAETNLAQAPENSAIYPTDDGQTFSLWFYQYGLGSRPDVKIISNGLLHYPWYRENLFRIYPNLKLSDLE